MFEDPSLPSVPEEDAALPSGARLGKYQIVRLLGAGGMGAVYEALHTELRKPVAIKTLAPAVAAIPGARQRFLREAELTSRLRHPHIVVLSDMGAEGRVAYLVMELLEGEDLSHRLDRAGAMAPRELVDLMLPVCSALVAAHEAGIVHRDLKPQNIFLAMGPQGITPKVLDFGISKSSDADASAQLTSTGSVIGTPHYLAPEQIKDSRSASRLSDQYSIGVILYRCLANVNPFEGENVFAVLQSIVNEMPIPLRERRRDLPEGLDRVVARAMHPVPSRRYPSVRELGRALLRYASPKARVIWEETFAVGPEPIEPEPEGPRGGATVPMETPQRPFRPVAGVASGRRRFESSGTLSPAVTSSSLGLGGAPRGRGKMIAVALLAAALGGGAFALFTRGSTATAPTPAATAPAATPVDDSEAKAAAKREAEAAAKREAEAREAAAREAREAAAREAAAREAAAREAAAKEEGAREEAAREAADREAARKAAAHKRASGKHHAAPDSPGEAPQEEPSLNPNGAPVID
jgi:serine/threonine-protein kinase